MRRVDVDRMRRYRHGGRVPRGLELVRGPWPERAIPVLLPENMQGELMSFQRAAGLLVDGVIGPQTWAALAAENERRTA